MSTVQSGPIWALPTSDKINSKYEKCLNITEEIYKRINITFQIKKLENPDSEVSDHSERLDSNDISNETDLFACDKSDITSSEAEKPATSCEKYININNNEETKLKKNTVVPRRPKKRFRKRIKKRPLVKAASESDSSSDEAIPLSRMVELDTKAVDSEGETSRSESLDHVMGVPNIVIVTKDFKSKVQTLSEFKIKSPVNKKKQTSTTEVNKTKTIENNTSKDENKSKVEKHKTKVENHTSKVETRKSKVENKSKEDNFTCSKIENDMKAENDKKLVFLLKKTDSSDKKSKNSSGVKSRKNKNADDNDKSDDANMKKCNICEAYFRGDAGLRRHVAAFHPTTNEKKKGSK